MAIIATLDDHNVCRVRKDKFVEGTIYRREGDDSYLWFRIGDAHFAYYKPNAKVVSASPGLGNEWFIETPHTLTITIGLPSKA